MPPLATVDLDPDHPKRKVDLIVNNDHLRYRNFSKREEGLKRLSTSIHEGLRLDHTTGPVTHVERPLAIPAALKPSRSRKSTRKSRSSVSATLRLNASTIMGKRCGSQRVHNGEADIVSS
jgi:hypothetical protein